MDKNSEKVTVDENIINFLNYLIKSLRIIYTISDLANLALNLRKILDNEKIPEDLKQLIKEEFPKGVITLLRENSYLAKQIDNNVDSVELLVSFFNTYGKDNLESLLNILFENSLNAKKEIERRTRSIIGDDSFNEYLEKNKEIADSLRSISVPSTTTQTSPRVEELKGIEKEFFTQEDSIEDTLDSEENLEETEEDLH